MLSCHHLCAASGRRILFREAGFSLLPGSMLVVRGEEPAKTALLARLAGQIKPARGRISYDGRPIKQNAHYTANLLYLSSSETTPPALTVAQTVAQWAQAGGTDLLADAALDYFGLKPLKDHAIADLPEPLRQRLRLTPLLAVPRLIWLLDEPTRGLDDDGRQLLYALIANRCNQDGIVVLATQETGFMNPLLEIDLGDYAPGAGPEKKKGSRLAALFRWIK